MTDKEAMKLALFALEQMQAKANFECWNLDVCDEAIAALKARLAQPEQEPVAWWNDTGTHIDLNVSGRGTPLYTHPPQRKPLTDEQIFACENSVPDEIVSDRDWCIYFARAIEAKLKQKNGYAKEKNQ